MKKLLAANRSEIAIRIFRAASELGLRTVAIYSAEDRTALHRFKADEGYQIGKDKGPIESYLSIEEIMRIARLARVDAIHPGYGFLAENPLLAEACERDGILFVGPSAKTMRELGDKISARALAEEVGIPVIRASAAIRASMPEREVQAEARRIGLPLMIKASWGGGGRGMRIVSESHHLMSALASARREAQASFGNDELYFEKFLEQARHVEVQILGDNYANVVHLFERDCSIQRRNQKIVERAPAPYLDERQRSELCEFALSLARRVGYRNAGTVEFLLDMRMHNKPFFIEVNPRIQVEHTITEEITGIDIVKAQLLLASGARIGTKESGVPNQDEIVRNGHALQCRITTEDPRNNFVPDYGRITAYRTAAGFGIRLDGGNAHAGAVVSPNYDPLLEKITAWAPSVEEAVQRMYRALREFRVRGLATNLPFLENVVQHPKFLATDYSTRFIDETPELFQSMRRKDRGTRLLTYIADVTVNGYPDMQASLPENSRSASSAPALVPLFEGMEDEDSPPPQGSRQRLETLGAQGFARWMREHKHSLVTDTTMRDAHQSLLATRLRGYDILQASRSYAYGLPQLLSLECWGGATFDVAMRFLCEDPWYRLRGLRARVPNILLQMLLRGANGVGYKNYPDNAVRFFVRQAAEEGIDLFRIFDCLNWVENMRVAIDAAGETGKLVEGAICYTADLFDRSRRYDVGYYVSLAQELERAGVHILAIKDMAGLLRPAGARVLVKALKESVGLPIHLHTHDTSGLSGASVLAAVEAGVDAFDAAIDSFSGLTSQPCMGSLVAALSESERPCDLPLPAIRSLSLYWEQVRAHYHAFESPQRSGASEVYAHEMPGGQFTNLKEQARALGLDSAWGEIAKNYEEANRLLGDIVKVTPSSKVVGDLALLAASKGLSVEQAFAADSNFPFPDSLVDMLRGGLGWPKGGFPKKIRHRVLDNLPDKTTLPPLQEGERAGARLEPYDLEGMRTQVETRLGKTLSDSDLASYVMYPQVFLSYMRAREQFGPVEALPTPVFFYGLGSGESVSVEIEHGKTLEISCQALGAADSEGCMNVFFELNGQTRAIAMADRSLTDESSARRKAEKEGEIGSPMRAIVANVLVARGAQVQAGDDLVSLEAMKIETVVQAPQAGQVAEILVGVDDSVDTGDLLVVLDSINHT